MAGRWRALPWEAWLSIVVASVIIAFVATAEGFGTITSLFTVSRAFTLLGMLAVGQALVIAAGGIDLSVGSIFGLTGVLLGILDHVGYGFGVTLGVALGAGMAVGLVNGLLVTKFGFRPFIATFGMLVVLRAAAYLAQQGTIGFGGISVAGTPWSYLASGHSPLYLPPSFFILVALAVGTWLLLKYTRFGLWAYGTGGNLNAARAIGIPIDMVRTLTYVMSGALAGVAGMLNVGALQAVRCFYGAGMELTSLAAVIIGGASLAGGSASILGTLLAVVLFSAVRLGVGQMGLALHFQQVITGLIVLVALVVTRFSLRGGTAGRERAY